MTTKERENYTYKNAIKLQVTLCQNKYPNNLFFKCRSNPESQKYHIFKK